MVRILYQAAPSTEHGIRHQLDMFAESAARIIAGFSVMVGIALIACVVLNAIYPSFISNVADRMPVAFFWVAVEAFALSCACEARRGYIRAYYILYIFVKVVDLVLLSMLTMLFTIEAIHYYLQALKNGKRRDDFDVLIGDRHNYYRGPLQMDAVKFFILYAIIAVLWLIHVNVVPTAWRTYKFLGNSASHRVSTVESIVSNA